MRWAGRIGAKAGGVAPTLFLAALITLGGSSKEAFIANASLQVVACTVIAWCAMDPRLNRLEAPAWTILALAALLVTTLCLYMIPLPPGLWSSLPGREAIAGGYRLLGEPLPALPLTLALDETIFGLMKFIPAVAAFLLAAKLSPTASGLWAPWTIVTLALLAVGLGLAQVMGQPDRSFYLYESTNFGSPVGFMANVNHQATLLVMALPFGALLVSRMVIDSQAGDRNIGLSIILAAMFCVIILGVITAGSLAGYALLGVSLLLSVLIVRGGQGGRFVTVSIFAVSLVVAVMGVVAVSSPRLAGLGMTNLDDGPLSRADTYVRTVEGIADTMPFGAGLGSFQALFPSYEDPSQASSTRMNHAHNDYLEFVLELGVIGAAMLAALLLWIVWRSVIIWRGDGGEGSRVQKAASIAVLLVVMHSLVDYPLRTAAIAGLGGFCLGLMAVRPEQRSRRARRSAPGDDAPRHLVI